MQIASTARWSSIRTKILNPTKSSSYRKKAWVLSVNLLGKTHWKQAATYEIECTDSTSSDTNRTLSMSLQPSSNNSAINFIWNSILSENYSRNLWKTTKSWPTQTSIKASSTRICWVSINYQNNRGSKLRNCKAIEMILHLWSHRD